jgi:hypothetical protein
MTKRAKKRNAPRKPPGRLSRRDYPAIFGDSDRDIIPDVDDP